MNRAPISGVITDIEYRKGKFLVASGEIASAENEQNILTIRADDGTKVVFKQIAGLIARRIVCTKKVGDVVQAGERDRADQIRLAGGRDLRPRVVRGSLARHAGFGRYERAGAPAWAKLNSRGDLAAAMQEPALSRDIMLPDTAVGAHGVETGPARRRPPRAAYALPTLFTAGNIFLGYLSIIRSIQGRDGDARKSGSGGGGFRGGGEDHRVFVSAGWFRRPHCAHDEHDQRIRPRTGFAGGRDQLRNCAGDSGLYVGRAVCEYAAAPAFLDQLQRAGKFIAFLFLVCGAARLARFNIQKNPMPKNPGAPHRKYFVGLPIPAAAGDGGGGGVLLRTAIRSRMLCGRLPGRRCWRCSRF